MLLLYCILHALFLCSLALGAIVGGRAKPVDTASYVRVIETSPFGPVEHLLDANGMAISSSQEGREPEDSDQSEHLELSSGEQVLFSNGSDVNALGNDQWGMVRVYSDPACTGERWGFLTETDLNLRYQRRAICYGWSKATASSIAFTPRADRQYWGCYLYDSENCRDWKNRYWITTTSWRLENVGWNDRALSIKCWMPSVAPPYDIPPMS
ncbi:unnamed protein product [Periconia digitata]|uniref:Uncharacterized protein n=1 Tax=Periconia digitata TaxID=1303443 RepID=A0A9W4U9N1_9PLEO|nr:unnamed protein product [Periconia digitata]